MRDALVALGMGGPDSIKTIRPFLYNLFSDRDIINFHIGGFPQKLLARLISSSRARKLAPEYMKMGLPGGASPQVLYTEKLLEKVAVLYENITGTELRTFGAMCYYKPFIKDTAKILKKKEFRKLIFFPLYPQYSFTTTGACYSKLSRAADIFAPKARRVVAVPYWYTDTAYCRCLAKRILEAAAKLGQPIEKCHLVFSAHSIPMSFVNKGDPYVAQIANHVKILTEMTGAVNWEISYQSKTGPVAWLGPSTSDCLRKLTILQTNNIIIIPISFISDHIETLVEIDDQLLPQIRKNGLNAARTESLNDSEDFATAVAGIISGADNE